MLTLSKVTVLLVVLVSLIQRGSTLSCIRCPQTLYPDDTVCESHKVNVTVDSKFNLCCKKSYHVMFFKILVDNVLSVHKLWQLCRHRLVTSMKWDPTAWTWKMQFVNSKWRTQACATFHAHALALIHQFIMLNQALINLR